MTSAAPGGSSFARRSREALQLLNGEWVPDILEALTHGATHYSTILVTIRKQPPSEISSGKQHRYLQEGVLSRTLRRLVDRGLIVRHVETSFPRHTTYELTSTAEELMYALGPVLTWGDRHADLICRDRCRTHPGAEHSYYLDS